MNFDDAFAVLVLATALRVFAPDVRWLTRRLLGAGVRVGAAALVEHRQLPLPPADALVATGRDEEALS